MNSVMLETTCIRCRGSLVNDYERAEIVCGKCGLVADSEVSESFTPVNVKVNVGGSIPDPTFLKNGVKVTSSKAEIRKVRMEAIILGMLGRLGAKKHIEHEALILGGRCASGGLARGRGVRPVAAACVYIACRCGGREISSRKISKIEGIQGKRINYCIRMIKEKYNLKYVSTYDQFLTVLSFACNELGASRKMMDDSIGYYKKLEESRNINGKSPRVIAGACLSVACGGKYQVGIIAEVTENTVAGMRPVRKLIMEKWK